MNILLICLALTVTKPGDDWTFEMIAKDPDQHYSQRYSEFVMHRWESRAHYARAVKLVEVNEAAREMMYAPKRYRKRMIKVWRQLYRKWKRGRYDTQGGRPAIAIAR